MRESSVVNPRMLTLARETRGYTQKELVGLVPNLNQGNYSKMEKGLLNVPYDTLVNIAQVVNYPVHFFYKEGVRTPISSFYYRRRVSMAKKNLNVLEAKLDVIRMAMDDLLDSVDIPGFDLPHFRVSEFSTPSEIAVKLRDYLKVPSGPINNIVKLVESCGIIVYFVTIDIDKFDGITLVTDKGHPIIFINRAMSNDRKRFTIAHELFHLIAHIPFSPLPSHQDEEKEANEFAAEFLMPFLECRYDLQDLKFSRLDILKSYWRMSKAAIIYRAKEIGAISDDRFTYLNIELSRRGERKKENGTVDIDNPRIVDLIVDVYQAQLGYTANDFVGLLAIPTSDFTEYFIKNNEVTVSAKKVIPLTSRIA